MTTSPPIECTDDTFVLGPISSTFPGASVRFLIARMTQWAESARAATLIAARDHPTQNIQRAYMEQMWKTAAAAYGYLQAIADLTGMDDQTQQAWVKYIRGMDVPLPDPDSLVPVPTGRETRQ